MIQKTNQLKIGVILSYITTGLNMLIQLAYTPIMIRVLGQSEYGLYTLVGGVVSYLSLFSLGFTGAYLRFYSRYRVKGDQQNIARLNGMFLSLFLVMSAVAFICGMILSQFTAQLLGKNLTSEELVKAEILMKILVINIALTFPSSIFDSIISAQEQFLFQRLLNLAGILFNPLICLPLLLLGYGSVAIVSVTTIVTLTKLCVNTWYCLKKLHVLFYFRHFDWLLLREIAGFSFFLFLNMIIDQVNFSVDKFILGRVSGTAAVAVYGVGAQVNSLYTSFSTAISSVLAPKINRIGAHGQTAEIKKEYTRLFIRVGRVQFIVLALICSGFIIFGDYFVTEIYATSEYIAAYPVALLLIIPPTIPLIQNLGVEIQRALNKHQARSIIYTAMAFFNVAISIPLAIYWGPAGAALGTALSVLIANGLIMNVYYYKVLGINIPQFWRSILKMSKALIPCILAGIIVKCFIHFSNIYIFGIGVLCYIGIYAFSFWRWGMNKEEKDLIRGIKNRLHFPKS